MIENLQQKAKDLLRSPGIQPSKLDSKKERHALRGTLCRHRSPMHMPNGDYWDGFFDGMDLHLLPEWVQLGRATHYSTLLR